MELKKGMKIKINSIAKPLKIISITKDKLMINLSGKKSIVTNIHQKNKRYLINWRTGASKIITKLNVVK